MSLTKARTRAKRKIEDLRTMLASLDSPAFTLLPHQTRALWTPGRWKLIVCGRRWGKTLAALHALLYGHGANREYRGVLQGDDGVWIAPDFAQARAVWRTLMRYFRGIPGIEITKNDWTLTFPNGATLEVRSAENIDSVRGRKFGGAVIEEAAYLDFEYAFGSVLRPALTDLKGWCIVISTPKVGSAFNALCASTVGQQNGMWTYFTGPTRENSALDPEEIESLYASYPPGSTDLRQELEAELIQDHGELFDLSMANYYDSATLDGAMISGVLAPFVERRVYVDLAASLRQSGDYTVLLIVGLTARTAGRRRAAVLDVVRKRLEGPDQVSMIKEAAAAYVPSVVKVEAVGYALTMVQSLKRELKTKVEPLRPDKDKRSRAIPAAAALARGDILLPKSARWMPEFLAELVAFPHGRHDDQVDALAYAAADLVMSRTRAVSLKLADFPSADPFSGQPLHLDFTSERLNAAPSAIHLA